MKGEIIVASWPKNGREILMVKLTTYKGQAILDCRAWYPGSDGSMKPGRGGLTVSIRHLPALAEATAKALATATAAGLIAGSDPRTNRKALGGVSASPAPLDSAP